VKLTCAVIKTYALFVDLCSVIFTNHVNLVWLLEQDLYKWGFPVICLPGEDTIVQFKDDIEAWSQPSQTQASKNVALVYLASGSKGLNLIAATSVILFDFDWQPEVEMRALGQTYGIGQTSEVDVIRLEADQTIEHYWRMNQKSIKDDHLYDLDKGIDSKVFSSKSALRELLLH
jgi:SNF2 family DNA or RNA helicase